MPDMDRLTRQSLCDRKRSTRMKARIFLSLSALAALSLAAFAQPEPGKKDAKQSPGSLYPLATCPISGEKLGGMGEPVVKEYDGREVRFCCKSCPPKFEKDTAASMAKLDA